MSLDHLFRQQAQPALQGRPVFAVEHIAQPGTHLAGSQIKVAGCQGVLQGFLDQSMLFEPG